MAGRRLLRTAIVAAVAILSSRRPVPPRWPPAPTRPHPASAPRIVYAQGYYCLTLIVGVNRSTDDQTPQSQLTYDVFADGRRIGSMADLGSESGVWSIQHLTHTGPTPSPSRRSTRPATGPHPAPAPALPTS